MTTDKSNGENGSATAGGDLAASHTMRDFGREVLERKAAGAPITETVSTLSSDAEAEQAALAAAFASYQTQTEDEEIATLVSEALTNSSFCPNDAFKVQVTIGKPKGTRLDLGRILAAINRTETVASPYGPAVALCGMIRAIAYQRGDLELSARKMFLTRPLAERLANMLSAMQEREPSAILMADIQLELEATGKTPNSYSWQPTLYLRGEAAKASRAYLTAPRRMVGGGAGVRTALPGVTG